MRSFFLCMSFYCNVHHGNKKIHFNDNQFKVNNFWWDVMIYLKQCLSYMKSYHYIFHYPCTLQKKAQHLFPAPLHMFMILNDMYMYDVRKFTPHGILFMIHWFYACSLLWRCVIYLVFVSFSVALTVHTHYYHWRWSVGSFPRWRCGPRFRSRSGKIHRQMFWITIYCCLSL